MRNLFRRLTKRVESWLWSKRWAFRWMQRRDSRRRVREVRAKIEAIKAAYMAKAQVAVDDQAQEDLWQAEQQDVEPLYYQIDHIESQEISLRARRLHVPIPREFYGPNGEYPAVMNAYRREMLARQIYLAKWGVAERWLKLCPILAVLLSALSLARSCQVAPPTENGADRADGAAK